MEKITNPPAFNWTSIDYDDSDYYVKIGRGHVKETFVAEIPEGKIYKSVFQRIENEDNVVLHSESMVFIPTPSTKGDK